jgi:hypothetical protein
MHLNTVHHDDKILIYWLNLSEYDAVVAGGAALRWFQGYPVGLADIDIFFSSHKDYQLLADRLLQQKHSALTHKKTTLNSIADLFSIVNTNKSNTVEQDQFTISLISDTANASTFEVTACDTNKWKIQLIKNNYHKTAVDLLNRFDISICKIATDGERWWVGDNFIEHLSQRRFTVDRYNSKTFKRIVKYMSYGYELSPECWTNVCSSPQVEWFFETPTEDDYNEQ